MEENFSKYTIEYEKVASDKSILAITRITANDIMKNPYMTLGQFFKNISDRDLAVLLAEVEHVDHCTKDTILLTEMLCRAEGVISESAGEIASRVGYFSMMITCVSLARKGLVRVYYENMSFGDEEGDKLVVEKLE